MAEHSWLAERFEANRPHLQAVAYRILGSQSEAALIDGTIGVVVAPNGQLRLVLTVQMRQGKIAAMDAIADPDHLQRLDLVVLNG